MSDDDRNPAVTEPAPSEANGAPIGTSSAIGEPNTLPLTFCRVCQVEVKPEGKGRCPRCQTFLRLNFSARKHPVNKLRREQLLDKFVRDYRPTTQRLQSMCEQYADVTEQLEGKKADGSTHYQRLLQSSLSLGAALEESRSAAAAPSSSPSGITEIRRVIVHADGREWPTPDARSRELTPEASTPQENTHAPAALQSASTSTTTTTTCRYGCGSLSECRSLKTTRLDLWRVFHFLDPEEVERRNAEATATMFKMAGKTSPYL